MLLLYKYREHETIIVFRTIKPRLHEVFTSVMKCLKHTPVFGMKVTELKVFLTFGKSQKQRPQRTVNMLTSLTRQPGRKPKKININIYGQ